MKNAYLVKLVDAEGDMCALLVSEEVGKGLDNDLAVMLPGSEHVLNGDTNSYECWYAQTYEIIEMMETARKNGWNVLKEELQFVHY